MKQYHDALREVLEEGVTSTDRTGTGTISHFGMQQRYRMADGFPLVTTNFRPEQGVSSLPKRPN